MNHGICIIAETFECFFGLLHLLVVGLFGQLLDVDLRSQTTTRSDSLAAQLLEGLQVLIGEGVGADGAEGSRGASTGSEELDSC